MRKAPFFMFLLCIYPVISAAQEECVSIKDDSQRLACYDTANGNLVQEIQSAAFGKWSKSTDVSPMTDEKTVFLVLESDDFIPDRFGRGAGPVTMYLRCKENTTSAFFVFNGNFMSDVQGYGRIEYRLDEQSMTSVNTDASTSNEVLGLWSGRRSIPFIKRMIGSERMVLRATPFNESAITVTFDTRGLQDALVELRDTCNW